MRRTVAFLLLYLVAAPTAWADTAVVTGQVVRTLVDSENFGGCMAQLDISSGALPSACKPDWVSFSCSGEFNAPEHGYRKLDAAQLALATETPVTTWVVDTKLHNGYCFAWRLDNRAP